MEIVRLYTASACPSRGAYGRHVATTSMVEQPIVRVVAGRGVLGNRRLAKTSLPANHVTLFSEEVWLQLLDELEITQADPGVLRCNLLVRGADLRELIGTIFALQDIRFKGAGYREPGSWLDAALWPGTASWLMDRKAGGLRAVPLASGVLVCDAEPRKTCDDAP